MATLPIEPVLPLPVAPFFAALAPDEKIYAHHLSRACWAGARVLMNQVSPESEGIYDFIMAVHAGCGGDWRNLDANKDEVDAFLEYAATVCNNFGNYLGQGDSKFIPDLSREALRRIASISPTAEQLLEKVIDQMLALQPSSLGFDGPTTQTAYYPSPGHPLTAAEVACVDGVLGQHGIEPENTRIRKVEEDGTVVYEVLIASANPQPTRELDSPDPKIRIIYSDHARVLARMNTHLLTVADSAPTPSQTTLLRQLVDAFTTGDQRIYRESQKTWVSIHHPSIETTWGFIEPYRDPAGVRGEWQSEVRILDQVATQRLARFGEGAEQFTTLLPWAEEGVNNGKGEFEPARMDIPSFTMLHALATCGSQVFEASCLPNYNDIKQTHGSKNLVILNRMDANTTSGPSPYLPPDLAPAVAPNNSQIRFVVTAIHELLGHATGKMMAETEPGVYNFDIKSPPISPLTGEKIETWYNPGETWTGVMGKFAASAEECRAMLVSYYLVDSPEILAILGVTESVDDFIYHTYLMIGVWGINSLRHYNPEQKAWKQAHARANYTILRHLLADANGVYTIAHDPTAGTVHVHVDRARILTHARPSIGRILSRIHIWRCSANVAALQPFYDGLGVVDGCFEEWRRDVVRCPEPRWKFVHANPVMEGEGVVLKEYEASNAGVIQSFADRDV